MTRIWVCCAPCPPPHWSRFSPGTLRGVTYLIVAAGTVAVGAGLLTSTAPLAAGLPQDTSTAAVGGPWVAIAGVYGTGRIADFTAADAPAPGVSILEPAGDVLSALCTTGGRWCGQVQGKSYREQSQERIRMLCFF